MKGETNGFLIFVLSLFCELGWILSRFKSNFVLQQEDGSMAV